MFSETAVSGILRDPASPPKKTPLPFFPRRLRERGLHLAGGPLISPLPRRRAEDEPPPGCRRANLRTVTAKNVTSGARWRGFFPRRFKAAGTALCRHSVDRSSFHVGVGEGRRSSVCASSLARYFLHYRWRFLIVAADCTHIAFLAELCFAFALTQQNGGIHLKKSLLHRQGLFSLAAVASAEVNKPRERLLFRKNNWQPAGGYTSTPIWWR